MKNPKLILLVAGAILLVVGGYFTINYLSTTHSVVINYSDISQVTITNKVNGTIQQVATISKSGDSIRLTNTTDYDVNYKGNSGFASGSIALGKSANAVTITPDYSADKYASIIATSLPNAHQLIMQKYPNVDTLFTTSSGGMMERGRWFVVKLTHKGEATYDSDNLKILLENVNGTWELRTKPDILFTLKTYPSIPLDILSWADKQ